MESNQKGTLYLVATPIGNLEDITFRALDILKNVDLIIAEDTRQTLKLLNHFEISKPLESYHRHSDEEKLQSIIDELNNGINIAEVTDAGTPAISDPGEDLVKEAIKNDIKIVPIPGACALVNALIPSGLDTKEFKFYGFLPLNNKLRKEKIEEIEKEKSTIIIYEAPHRIEDTLKELQEKLGNRNISVAKEITKIHENFYRGKISEVREQIQNPKGEFIIVIEGNQNQVDDKSALNNLTLEEHYRFYEAQGLEKKEIIKKIAKDRNVNKNEIYQKFLEK